MEVDVAYHYLSFFLDDDAKLEFIRSEYASGRMMTSQIKNILIDVLVPIIEGIQKNREMVTDDIVRSFMKPRDMKIKT